MRMQIESTELLEMLRNARKEAIALYASTVHTICETATNLENARQVIHNIPVDNYIDPVDSENA